MKKILYQEAKFKILLAPVSNDATANSGYIDRTGFAEVDILLSMGADSGTYSGTNKKTVTIQHSDSPTTGYEAVPEGQLEIEELEGTNYDLANGVWFVLNGDTARDALKSKTHIARYSGSKRYVRAVITKAASARATILAINAIAYNGIYKGQGDLQDDVGLGAMSSAVTDSE